MSNLKNIRKFEYRPSRLKVGIDIDFRVGEETLHGVCRNVSDTGVCAEFDGVVLVGSFGELILRHSSRLLNIEAQVAYIEKSQVGLVFLLRTPLECEATAQFIAALARYSFNIRSKQ